MRYPLRAQGVGVPDIGPRNTQFNPPLSPTARSPSAFAPPSLKSFGGHSKATEDKSDYLAEVDLGQVATEGCISVPFRQRRKGR